MNTQPGPDPLATTIDPVSEPSPPWAGPATAPSAAATPSTVAAGAATEPMVMTRAAPRRRLGGAVPLVVAAALLGGIASSGATYAVVTLTGATVSASSATSSTSATTVALSSTTSGSLAAAVAKASRSVVTITVQTTSGGGFGGGTATGVGSGIVMSSDGLILTNAHVVSGATSIEVTLPDGSQATGTLVGTSTTTDLAIIRVSASGLTAATLGDSSALQVGQTVVAIGDPLGEFAGSASAGIVSALDRTITVENDTLSGLIQTDAAVNGGNSGGPLIDASGNVVGVVTASSSSAEGIAFAIPISAANSLVAQALAGTLAAS